MHIRTKTFTNMVSGLIWVGWYDAVLEHRLAGRLASLKLGSPSAMISSLPHHRLPELEPLGHRHRRPQISLSFRKGARSTKEGAQKHARVEVEQRREATNQERLGGYCRAADLYRKTRSALLVFVCAFPGSLVVHLRERGARDAQDGRPCLRECRRTCYQITRTPAKTTTSTITTRNIATTRRLISAVTRRVSSARHASPHHTGSLVEPMHESSFATRPGPTQYILPRG